MRTGPQQTHSRIYRSDYPPCPGLRPCVKYGAVVLVGVVLVVGLILSGSFQSSLAQSKPKQDQLSTERNRDYTERFDSLESQLRSTQQKLNELQKQNKDISQKITSLEVELIQISPNPKRPSLLATYVVVFGCVFLVALAWHYGRKSRGTAKVLRWIRSLFSGRSNLAETEGIESRLLRDLAEVHKVLALICKAIDILHDAVEKIPEEIGRKQSSGSNAWTRYKDLQINQRVTPVVAPGAGSPPPAESRIEEFLRLYNTGVDDEVARTEFRERYQPIRIGVTNAMDRRRNSSITPEFRKANDGDFFEVQLEERGQVRYAVVPRFDLTFQEPAHDSGAMGFVFDCPNYDASLRYRHVKVVRPAFFEPGAELRWILKEKGELNLGQAE